MSAINHCKDLSRHLLLGFAMVLMASTPGAIPAHADDIAGNRSAVIRGLLPTVVNITVRKLQVANTPATQQGRAGLRG